MKNVRCDKCGGSAEDPGAITIRILEGQLPMRRARVDLCKSCWGQLERWLSPPRPLADHVRDAKGSIDDDQGEGE